MAVLNCYYLSVTSSATPKTQESSINSSQTQPTLPTKIILPKKKPMKWSIGDAPGEYGGPPTTTKLRKYWGKDEDPLTSDDFIWNKEFMGRMKKYVQDPQEKGSSPAKEEASGFLSLNRVMSLDSMEIDLTEKLVAPSKPMLDPVVEESQASITASRKWRPAPTRREQEKWDRAAKAATGGSLKDKLQFLTLGIGGVGIVSACVSYSPEIAASYGAGLLGSLMYMRMLGNSVDSIRTDGPKALIKQMRFHNTSLLLKKLNLISILQFCCFLWAKRNQGGWVGGGGGGGGGTGFKGLHPLDFKLLTNRGAAGQPRLLVPVVLVMIYNRWNGILAAEYGLMHLELIPMLVGFLTYKIATFAQAIEEAVTVVGGKKTET
ncbi:hypothetical protein RND71_004719 [Anisodus tanguticus]|uniref:CGL160/ATPI domain-containing protein n=1 Tax=Anisodus tanguticus TaxID=243964 RepID=A0AAE1SRG7_9SOLA|nr:hypothetical protein RND71_004719 [Anisodus tanguticus]